MSGDEVDATQCALKSLFKILQAHNERLERQLKVNNLNDRTFIVILVNFLKAAVKTEAVLTAKNAKLVHCGKKASYTNFDQTAFKHRLKCYVSEKQKRNQSRVPHRKRLSSSKGAWPS